MEEYDPFAPFTNEDTVASTPRLGVAYEIANNALEAGYTLERWRDEVMRQSITVSESDSEGDESDDDFEIQR